MLENRFLDILTSTWKVLGVGHRTTHKSLTKKNHGIKFDVFIPDSVGDPRQTMEVQVKTYSHSGIKFCSKFA